jgi:hypothetical protein
MADNAIVVLTVDQFASVVRRDVVPEILELLLNKPEPPTLLTKRALARELSCSESTVDRLVRRGMPSIRVLDARRFDLKKCIAWNQAQGGSDESDDSGTSITF